MSGVATFPQGFVCGINPSTTKQRTQQAPRCLSGPHAGVDRVPSPWTRHFPTAMGTRFHKGSPTAEHSWAPSCAREGTSPGAAETCSHLSPSSTPFPSTPGSCQSLVIQPVPISMLSSRSITPSPHLPCQFSPLVCPLSTFFALSISAIPRLLPASLKLLKPQGKDCMARHHFTWLSKRQHCPEDGLSTHRSSVAGWCHLPWVSAYHWDCRAATSLASAGEQLGWHRSFGEASARQLSRIKKVLKKNFSKRNNIFKLIVFLN